MDFISLDPVFQVLLLGLHDSEIMLANTVMIGCVTLAALLLADILYAVADPRVSYA